MGEYRGRMTVPGVVDWPLSVKIELEDERISIAAAGFPIGVWPLDEIEVLGREQGFEIVVDGEHLFVSTSDDAVFATELGMAWSAPVTAKPASNRMGEAGAGVRRSSRSAATLGSDLRHQLVDTRAAGRPPTKLTIGRGRHERRRGRHRMAGS